MAEENSTQNTDTENDEETTKVFENKFTDKDQSKEATPLVEDPFKEKYYYLAAEFENSKKRFEREKMNIVKFGCEQILRDLLGPIDLFELTVSALVSDQDPKIKNLVVGLEMIRKQMLDGLSKHGLEKIDSLNQDFDPNFHEAVAQEAMENIESNKVIKELQSGFLLNGRLLRASKVVVSTKN